MALLSKESSFVVYVGDGIHFLRLKAADALGNEFENTTAWQWILDTTPPTSQVLQGPASPSLSGNAEFQVECTSSSPGGAAGSDCVEYEYMVAVALSSGCGTLVTHRGQVEASGVIQVDGIRSGENSLTISAVDSVGLKQLVPSFFSWTVQLTSDMIGVTIVSGPATLCALKIATFQCISKKV
jgi:hypothetical protein